MQAFATFVPATVFECHPADSVEQAVGVELPLVNPLQLLVLPWFLKKTTVH
jgi:hypothetical protein